MNKRFNSWKEQFDVFVDKEGILRCRGRLTNANLPTEMKYPVLLERRSTIALLLVKDCHVRVGHGGVNSTLTEVRSRYWIVQGRQLVRQVIRNCFLCKRYQGRSYPVPPPPPLPPLRVEEKPPFWYTGIDFAGPMYTRETLSSESRKVWTCLFTCCVTRAVHIELVTELETVTFLRCFKRFTARRGFPSRILSDNAKTFKAANKWLSTILEHPKVKEFMIGNGIRWQFNVERAPWWGGVFERIMKRLLRKIIGTSKFTYDELMTAVIEVEAMLNSRPLTYIPSGDLVEPLTPSHLLCGRRLMTLPDKPEEEEDSYVPGLRDGATQLSRRMKHLTNILDKFWMRWRCEYLLELRNAHRKKWRKGSADQPNVSIGDIVLVEDDQLPRGFWKLGNINELIVGRDGEIRAAVVRTHSKDGKTILLKRPLQSLYPLEGSDDSGLHSSLPSQELSKGKPIDTVEPHSSMEDHSLKELSRRPKRTAALRARDRIGSWTRELLGSDMDNDNCEA